MIQVHVLKSVFLAYNHARCKDIPRNSIASPLKNYFPMTSVILPYDIVNRAKISNLADRCVCRAPSIAQVLDSKPI